MNLTRALRITSLLAILALVSSFGVSCNTIEGVGEDVSAAGQTVADWADDSKPENE